MSLAVVCFLWWEPQSKWRDTFTYGPHHVVTLRNMVARNLTVPHRFVCVTDGHFDLPSDIETVPLDTSLITPSERYAKLQIFRPDAAELFGADYLLMLDLDMVITDNIDHLVNHGKDFKAWLNPKFKKQPRRRSRFNSSLVYLKAGARPHVWTEFDIKTSPKLCQKSGAAGTDQTWMSMNVLRPDDQGWMSGKVDPDEASFTEADGIYSYKVHVRRTGLLSSDARMVIFHGRISPCMAEMKRFPWVKENYQ